MNVRTKSVPYAERGKGYVAPAGYGVSLEPAAGFYRYRLGRDTIVGGVRLWKGPPLDPITGELLDRHWRWQALFNGEPIDFERVWPACAGDPITEQEYNRFVARMAWARKHAPDSAHAEPGRKHDPLSTNSVLPF